MAYAAALTFIYLLFAISHSEADSEIVHDINGQSVEVGQRYFILPVLRGSGGGLTTDSMLRSTCSDSVIQESNELSNGIPVIFLPQNSTGNVIRVSTNMKIQFSPVGLLDKLQFTCALYTYWKLSAHQYKEKQLLVSIGKDEDSRSLFKLEIFESDYVFRFCPFDCVDYCKTKCGNVGIYFDNHVRRLGLSDTPFRVMFKKVLSGE